MQPTFGLHESPIWFDDYLFRSMPTLKWLFVTLIYFIQEIVSPKIKTTIPKPRALIAIRQYEKSTVVLLTTSQSTSLRMAFNLPCFSPNPILWGKASISSWWHGIGVEVKLFDCLQCWKHMSTNLSYYPSLLVKDTFQTCVNNVVVKALQKGMSTNLTLPFTTSKGHVPNICE